MFESFVPQNTNVVLVTGPQRTGTNICAEMIAHDTGLTLLRENSFDTTDLIKFGDLVSSASRCVIQCPAMCRYIHWFGQREDVLVVMMIRAVEEIIKSQERIDWKEGFELARYGLEPGGSPIATVKYFHWQNEQRLLVKNWQEVEYRSLAQHPLWVPDDQRKNFTFDQTHL